jgi:NAD(P)-dependent dehydrogenase (short-subunit alcohol dehydrogenase family)
MNNKKASGIMSKPLFDLTGKTAIVTGGTKGIGLAISLMLADHGADIVVASRTVDDCDKVAQQIEAMGRKALACPTDVSKLSDFQNLFKAYMEKFARLTSCKQFLCRRDKTCSFYK